MSSSCRVSNGLGFDLIGLSCQVRRQSKGDVLGGPPVTAADATVQAEHRLNLVRQIGKMATRKKEKKGEKRNLEWQTGCSPRPPTLTQRYVVLMLGALREVVISFKFRLNLLNGFRDVGVEICHFLYLRPVAYITACKPW